MEGQAQSPFTIDSATPGNVFCHHCQKSLKMATSAAHVKTAAHIRLAEAAARKTAPAPEPSDRAPEAPEAVKSKETKRRARAGK